MTESKELVIVDQLVPADIFKNGGMDPILSEIEKKAKAHIPDLTTVKGRKAIASNAAKVASSKTLLDKMGKTLKDQYKVLIDPIDGERKKTRDFLDALKVEVRKPLTDWEEEEKAKAAAKKLAEEIEAAWEEALAYDDLVNRQREIEKEEARLKKIEEERIRKEAEEAERKAQIEREERMKAEAAAKAKAEAEEAAQKQRDLEKFLSDFDMAIEMNKAFDIKRDERLKKEKAKKALDDAAKARIDILGEIGISLDFQACRDMPESTWVEFYDSKKKAYDAEQNRLWMETEKKKAAEKKAKEDAEAESKRLADIKAAEEAAAREAARIEAEKQAEIDRLNRIEQERIAEENRMLAEQKKRDEDKEHRGSVNRAIVAKLISVAGCDAEKAQEFVKQVILGEVDNMSITY